MPTSDSIDLTLLDGMSFRCRPGCGLCCYTTPAVDPADADRLIQLDPAAPLLDGEDGWRYVADQGEGGACHFLSRCQCRAYDRRPFCCQEFPLSVHVGIRAQATVVLSCPGVSVRGWGAAGLEAHPRADPEGLATELAAVQREYLRQPIEQRMKETSRRWRSLRTRLMRSGGWTEPTEIRSLVRGRVRKLARAAFPPPAPPQASDGIDALPLLFDAEAGLVAISDHPSGWELISIEETGTSGRSLGVWPAPTRLPAVTAEGEALLSSYLDHLLDRDFTYWAAAEAIRAEDGVSLSDTVEEDVARFGALVLARAQLIERFHAGGSGPLSAGRIWDGIRATDGEFLDRPTLGWVL